MRIPVEPSKLDRAMNWIPHWSDNVEWADGRWDPMENAPVWGAAGAKCSIRGRTPEGRVIENIHYAQDLSGDEQPPFAGWFTPSGSGFQQVNVVEWQPTRAKP